MTDSPASDAATAVALAELRGTVAEGFATVNGSLNLLAQRTDQTDKRLDDHETRLDALERARWPLPTIGALAGVAGVVAAVWQGTAH